MIRNNFFAIIAALLLISACQSPSPIEVQSTSTPKPVPSLSASQVNTATQTPTATELPLIEETIDLPPPGQVISRVDVGDANLVALTFDDGFGKVPFDATLDELKKRDLRVTFFLVGLASINLGEERMARLVQDGHQIAYHSYAHEDLNILRNWKQVDWLADYEKWEAAMIELLGAESYASTYRPYARAPYGLFDSAFLGMTKELGLVPVGWSNDPGDLLRGIDLRAGDIFLFHVRYPDYELMGAILDEYDFEFVHLDILFAAQISD